MTSGTIQHKTLDSSGACILEEPYHSETRYFTSDNLETSS